LQDLKAERCDPWVLVLLFLIHNLKLAMTKMFKNKVYLMIKDVHCLFAHQSGLFIICCNDGGSHFEFCLIKKFAQGCQSGITQILVMYTQMD